MKKTRFVVALAALFIAGTALGYVTNVYELENFTPDLSFQPIATDLAQVSGSNFFESGGFYVAAWPGCTLDMLFNATGNPSDGYNGYGAGADGIYGAGVIFQDYQAPVVQTDFEAPKAINEIRVFSGHQDGRAFVNCAISFSTDGITFNQFIIPGITNLQMGAGPGDQITNYGTRYSNCLARVYNTDGSAIASNVKAIQYKFYDCSFGTEFRPIDNGAQGTVAREIDVIGVPEPVTFGLIGLIGFLAFRKRG